MYSYQEAFPWDVWAAPASYKRCVTASAWVRMARVYFWLPGKVCEAVGFADGRNTTDTTAAMTGLHFTFQAFMEYFIKFNL